MTRADIEDIAHAARTLQGRYSNSNIGKALSPVSVVSRDSARRGEPGPETKSERVRLFSLDHGQVLEDLELSYWVILRIGVTHHMLQWLMQELRRPFLTTMHEFAAKPASTCVHHTGALASVPTTMPIQRRSTSSQTPERKARNEFWGKLCIRVARRSRTPSFHLIKTNRLGQLLTSMQGQTFEVWTNRYL